MSRIRVLVAKPGLDGHEAGAKLVAMALRDAGMEVIYTGPRQTPQAIATVAVQEDVDVIGLSVLSGAHVALCREVTRSLRAVGIREEALLVVGGIIPPTDIPALMGMGVDAVFGPGSRLADIVEWIRQRVQARGGSST